MSQYLEHRLPADIERTSLRIIREELHALAAQIPPENAAVVLRVIHATADLDYARTLYFTPDAAAKGAAALCPGSVLITDTNMALAGLSKPGLNKLGAQAFCYMADPAVAQAAKAAGTTRASAAMKFAAQKHPGAIFAIGNAPTALFTLADAIEAGLRPALVVAVPVGFVNVVEGKERLVQVCQRYGVPAIAAMGRKGGSTVAAAICNAMIYSASEMLDPAARGWN
ncbi:MAG: precorrin-8X methylmutase [Faecalibacterium sp.]